MCLLSCCKSKHSTPKLIIGYVITLRCLTIEVRYSPSLLVLWTLGSVLACSWSVPEMLLSRKCECVCVCARACVCVSVRVCARVHVCIHAYVCMCMYDVCVHMWHTHACACTHTHTNTHTKRSCIYQLNKFNNFPVISGFSNKLSHEYLPKKRKQRHCCISYSFISVHSKSYTLATRWCQCKSE